jgi:hypothetical protein
VVIGHSGVGPAGIRALAQPGDAPSWTRCDTFLVFFFWITVGGALLVALSVFYDPRESRPRRPRTLCARSRPSGPALPCTGRSRRLAA